MGHETKASQAEKQRRITEIYALIMSGARRPEILRIATERFNIKERQAENYYALAQDEIRETATQRRGAIYAEHIAHRRDLRFRARREGNLRVELDVSKDEAELLGLYPDKRLVISWRDEVRAAGHDPDELFASLVDAGRAGAIAIPGGILGGTGDANQPGIAIEDQPGDSDD